MALDAYTAGEAVLGAILTETLSEASAATPPAAPGDDTRIALCRTNWKQRAWRVGDADARTRTKRIDELLKSPHLRHYYATPLTGHKQGDSALV